MRNFTFTALALASLAFGCHHNEKVKSDDTGNDFCAPDTGETADTGVDTADTSVTATCTDSTGTYAVGDSWTCPDGCNTCTCVESDVIASSDMACNDTGMPPDTGADTGTSPSDTGATDTGSGGTDTATPA